MKEEAEKKKRNQFETNKQKILRNFNKVSVLKMCSATRYVQWVSKYEKKTLKMEANIYINLEINFGPFNQKHVKLFDAFE